MTNTIDIEAGEARKESSIRRRAQGIHQRLDRLVQAAAAKAGWSPSDVPRMSHVATVEFFSRLARDEPPEQALEAAMEAAERAQVIHFVQEAGARGIPMDTALLVLLKRRLNANAELDREAIRLAIDTFNAMLRGGHTVAQAIDTARQASIRRMRGQA